ncbi:MAG: type II secretion system protein M [Gammaproteobacteria bacterium]|nr:type II secretion system protein M [Gammaproteobacteria bacterium]
MARTFKDNIDRLRTRYLGLERRDRLALTALIVFVGGLVLVYGIWIPANEFVDSRKSDRDRQFELLQYMRSTEQEARTLGVNAPPLPSGQDLLTRVSRSAQQFGVSPNRLQPEGSNGVSVWFDGVPFNDLVVWLQEQTNQGVTVRQLSVDRQEEPGLVNARIVLRAG